MIGYLFTLTNQNGDVVKFNDFTTDANNFLALQDYPAFDLDIKSDEISKEGQHGIWDFFTFYGKRGIGFSGVIAGVAESNVETMKLLLMRVLSLPAQPSTTNDGSVTIKWTDANSNAWQTVAKVDRDTRFSRAMKQRLQLGFSVSLKSSDPRIVSQSAIVASGVRGYRQVSGLLPTLLPFIFGTSLFNSLTINHAGTIGANTLIRLNSETAGITNPKITNTTTGKYFKINTVIPSGGYIEIDSAAGTVVDNNGTDLTGLVDISSNLILLSAGNNVLLYESDENPYATLVLPTATFTVTYRTTII